MERKIRSSILDTRSKMLTKHPSGRGLGWRWKFGNHKLEVAFKARRLDKIVKEVSIEKRSKT